MRIWYPQEPIIVYDASVVIRCWKTIHLSWHHSEKTSKRFFVGYMYMYVTLCLIYNMLQSIRAIMMVVCVQLAQQAVVSTLQWQDSQAIGLRHKLWNATYLRSVELAVHRYHLLKFLFLGSSTVANLEDKSFKIPVTSPATCQYFLHYDRILCRILFTCWHILILKAVQNLRIKN